MSPGHRRNPRREAALTSAPSSSDTPAPSPPLWAGYRVSVSSIGAFPLVLAMPLMFFPKLLEGDTQPWVLMAALLALVTFRTSRFLLARDGALLALALFCVPVFALRAQSTGDLVRATYIYLSFAVLWLVCRRESGDIFPAAVKFTIVVWFVVGLYQYVFVALGLPIEISGRYVEGRSGVPSLTSEPATYGTLSLLQIMYLLGQTKGRTTPYLCAAAISIVLSGSLLAFALMIFPILRLPAKVRLPVVAAIVGLIAADFAFSASGVTSRVLAFNQLAGNLAAILLDASLNLRAGHLYFTLYENLTDSLLMRGEIAFMQQYNAFAARSSLFIDTGSNFILPAIGDVIYGTGVVGLALLVLFFRASLAGCSSTRARLQKGLFMLACMVNPISLSNVFLILYAQKKEQSST